MLSIIIPCYNVLPYVKKMIPSLIENKDIEYIFVDDKSQDGLLEFLNEQKFLNLKVIKNLKNLGLAKTRMNGVKAAKGDYLLFVDGDDLINIKNIIEILEGLSKNITRFPLETFDDRNKKRLSTWRPTIRTKKLFKNELFYTAQVSTYIFKKEFFINKNLHFFTAKFNEDNLFMYLVLDTNESQYYINKPLVKYRRYRKNSRSNTSGDFSIKIESFIEQAISLVSECPSLKSWAYFEVLRKISHSEENDIKDLSKTLIDSLKKLVLQNTKFSKLTFSHKFMYFSWKIFKKY